MSDGEGDGDTLVGFRSGPGPAGGGPPLRPYLVSVGGDLFLVCAPGISSIEAVVRDRRRIRGVRPGDDGGALRVVAVPMSPLRAEEAALYLGDMARSLSSAAGGG